MADYYETFVFAIAALTDDEIEWLRELEDDEEKLWEYGDDPADEFAGFEIDLRADERTAYIGSPESGQPENVGRFCQDFLARFRPDDYLSFEWAATCSRAQVDGFGGGAAFITADEAKFTWTGQWVHEQITAFNAGKDSA